MTNKLRNSIAVLGILVSVFMMTACSGMRYAPYSGANGRVEHPV